jgi:hypothetical protein
MRDKRMSGARIAVPLGLALAFAIAALSLLPRAFEAHGLLSIADDPGALADRAVAQSFNAEVADREIRAALAANDGDLAQSFLELARDRNVPVEAELAAKVEAKTAKASSAAHSIESFTRGLITGEPQDVSGLVGTAAGDLFVFGDIRDALREGTRLARGQEVDELILGLACVGLAVTAGTYATVGLAAPARIGLTVVKAAGKTGRIGGRLAAWIGRSLREVVDLSAVSRAVKVNQPAIAVRAVRDVVKVEKAQNLARFVGDVGRVQARAGTQAALDGLRLAEGPRDMSRMARLAATKGGKTRAILKLAGRGAILLLVGTFNLAMWLFWALVSVFGFVSALKRMCERATERYCAHRKRRRVRTKNAEVIMPRPSKAAVISRHQPKLVYRNEQPLVLERKPGDVGLLEYLARCPSRSPELALFRTQSSIRCRPSLEDTVLSFRPARASAA